MDQKIQAVKLLAEISAKEISDEGIERYLDSQLSVRKDERGYKTQRRRLISSLTGINYKTIKCWKETLSPYARKVISQRIILERLLMEFSKYVPAQKITSII